MNAKTNSTDNLYEQFRQLFSRGLPPSLLEFLTEEDLSAFLKERFEFIRNRPGKERFKLRIYNPAALWQSNRTTIEILLPDQPFVVDCLRAYLKRRGHKISLIHHPVMGVGRERGHLTSLAPPGHTEQREAYHFVEIDKQTKENLQEIKEDLELILAELQVMYRDFPEMGGRLRTLMSESVNCGPRGQDFIQWLLHTHFIVFGLFETDPGTELNRKTLPEADNCYSLGALRLPEYEDLPGQVIQSRIFQENWKKGQPGIVFQQLTTHSRIYTEYFLAAITLFFESAGEFRFCTVVGFFTEASYRTYSRYIPLVSDKIKSILSSTTELKESFNYKYILYIFDNLPLPARFALGGDTLRDHTLTLLTGVTRNDPAARLSYDQSSGTLLASFLFPREDWSAEFTPVLKEELKKEFPTASFQFLESQITEFQTLHIFVFAGAGDRVPGRSANKWNELTACLLELATTWENRFAGRMQLAFSGDYYREMAHLFTRAFSQEYREIYSPHRAVQDAIHAKKALESERMDCRIFYDDDEDRTGGVISLFTLEPVILSHIMPWFSSLGILIHSQNHQKLHPAGQSEVHLNNWVFSLEQPAPPDFSRRLAEALSALMDGHFQNDPINKLLTLTDLDWRQIQFLKSLRSHIRQLQPAYSASYFNRMLTQMPSIATDAWELFEDRVLGGSPPTSSKAKSDKKKKKVPDTTGTIDWEGRLQKLLSGTSTLAQESFIYFLFDVIRQITRSNWPAWVKKVSQPGCPPLETALAHKITTGNIESVPGFRPAREIFMYCPWFEGVHLRGGPVARGGIRWSDRINDFRTEILGLVSTQMVKNTLIVPTGSKGGFVIKRGNFTGAEVYQAYQSVLLSMTDNQVGRKITRPPDIAILDDYDPYLVVAADKGTAQFSDLANEVSARYNFWLDDAYASGGSHGYSHKGCGITARGAWESVHHHLERMGIDSQKDEFTVAGIGDMSGDVFGNGMLLSRGIRLLAAFNHRHIFLDPNPDPKISFKERQRLFRLKKAASWDAYDPKKLSPGGGVFERNVKRIALNRSQLDLLELRGEDGTEYAPAEIIRAILKMPVDLLYNGGIGTYVKATQEAHSDAGDRVNDELRINGNELRARSVSEGGNLGFTLAGRLEADENGVRINTDALDNSGGVDLSDHEVNLKILLRLAAEKTGHPGDMAGRDKLLQKVETEVVDSVLVNNRAANHALTRDEAQIAAGSGLVFRAWETLEKETDFQPADYGLEALSHWRDYAEKHHTLPRPVLALLLGYGRKLVRDILEADRHQKIIPGKNWKPARDPHLVNYFPPGLGPDILRLTGQHPLADSIRDTITANTFCHELGISGIGFLAGQPQKWRLSFIEYYVSARAALLEAFGGADRARDEELLKSSIPALISASFTAAELGLPAPLPDQLKNKDFRADFRDFLKKVNPRSVTTPGNGKAGKRRQSGANTEQLAVNLDLFVWWHYLRQNQWLLPANAPRYEADSQAARQELSAATIRVLQPRSYWETLWNCPVTSPAEASFQFRAYRNFCDQLEGLLRQVRHLSRQRTGAEIRQELEELLPVTAPDRPEESVTAYPRGNILILQNHVYDLLQRIGTAIAQILTGKGRSAN